jgi:release factor H-coupled RctB family protein
MGRGLFGGDIGLPAYGGCRDSSQPSRVEGLSVQKATVTVFASPSSWIESDAVDQCHQVAAFDGMLHVAGMQDLHPGKGAPIGAAMTSTVLYPHLC